MPEISIITPTYNHSLFISECIESVISQSYSDWELIIVNDGSTDNTFEIISAYAIKDSRIKIINNANKGIHKLSETYNDALAISHGEYIAILEGDDYWMPDKLQKQINIFKANTETILCWGMAQSIYGNLKKNVEIHPRNLKTNYNYYFNKPIGSFFNIIFNDFPAPLTFLIKKKSIIETGYFNQIYPFPSIDLPLLLKLSLQGPFYFIPEVLGFWRIHKNQITKNHSIEILTGSEMIVKSHYESLKDEIKRNIIFNEKKISKKYNNFKIVSYSRNGRINLIKKDFKNARKSYYKSIIINYPWVQILWKIRSLIGILFSFFHKDIEGLAKMLHKTNYK